MSKASDSQREIRKRIIDQRKAFFRSPEFDPLSGLVCRRFLEALNSNRNIIIERANNNNLSVGCYLPMDGEINLHPVFGIFSNLGWELSFPVVTRATSEMRFFGVKSVELDAFETGELGVLEPKKRDRPVTHFDLILVPAVAVDRSGNRIGMGKGFYDRFLNNQRDALRVALVFEFQIVDTLETQEWDQRVNWVFSEKSSILL